METNERSPGTNRVPTWIASDEAFKDEVRGAVQALEEFHRETTGKEPTSTEALAILKEAIRDAADYIRHKNRRRLAETTSHKLACTIAFIRAVERQDTENAVKMQQTYARLQHEITPQTSKSQWFAAVKDHAVELMRVDVRDRARELKQAQSSMPHEIYDSRK